MEVIYSIFEFDIKSTALFFSTLIQFASSLAFAEWVVEIAKYQLPKISARKFVDVAIASL